MKKIIYSLMLSCIVVTTAVAQEEVYNWFGTAKDDWFVDLNIGGDVLFNQDRNDIIANNGIGANVSISAGKWIMPYFAARLQIKSLMWRGAASADNMTNWGFDMVQFENPYSDGSCNYNLFYLNPHIDVMLSLYSCIYGGYKASQKWDVIPFIGMGYAHVFSGKGVIGGDCMTGNFGLQGKYRINNNWDINLELQTSILPDYYTNGAGKVTQEDLAFTIGATYNIGGHTFSQHAKKAKEQKANNKNGKDTVIVYNNTERIIERGAPASSGNLEKAAKSGNFNQAFQIALIEFALGDDQPKQNYETQYYNVAAFVKAYPNVKLRLDAYCDKDTGSEEVNARLAERRANTVRDILVNNYGIPEDIITLNPVGSTEQVYQEGELNRIVRITVLPK